jgi:hypothetical protein
MAKHKSCTPANFRRHLKSFGEPSDEDYAIILESLPSEVSKSDIFVYSVRICDSLVDRDGEFFSHDALVQLTAMYIGQPGIFDHEWESGNQHSRIYKTELVTELVEDDDINKMELLTEVLSENPSLRPYEYVVGYAYTLNSEENKVMINKIKAGILKEVSIGFDTAVETKVKLSDGEATRIDSIADVFEWSFVAVPAQRLAGVVKSFNDIKEGKAMSWKDAVVKLKSFQGVDASALQIIEDALAAAESSESEAVKGLKAKLKSAEEDSQTKAARVKELEDELVDTTLSHALKEVLVGLTPVSDSAHELAYKIAQDGLSVGDDGAVQGVEETKAKLKSEYPFLFGDTKSMDDEDEEDEPTEKGDDVTDETNLKSATRRKVGLDFTKTSAVTSNTKSTRKPMGLHFN